jgi:hypothetical protein
MVRFVKQNKQNNKTTGFFLFEWRVIMPKNTGHCLKTLVMNFLFISTYKIYHVLTLL